MLYDIRHLVSLEGHDLELSRGHKFLVDGTIDVEVVERRRILRAPRYGTPREPNMVGRTQNKDTFDLRM
jgi:hypothetical protein